MARGAILGGATEATEITVDLLCPGVSIKVRLPANDSPEDTRGFEPVTASGEIPILRAAALVIRGCTAPGTFVAGTGRARKIVLPFECPFSLE